MVFLGMVGAFLACAPGLARDAGTAEYDQSRLVLMVGTVVKIDFANPNSYVYIDVTGDDGNRAIWTLRISGADVLTKQGWKQGSVSPGTDVVVLVYRATDGTHRALANSIKLPDGRSVFTNPVGDEGMKR
jgi:hypothetical protein